MRILFLEQFSDMGGGQRNLVDLLPAVLARGWSATVAAPGAGRLFDAVRATGAKTEKITMGRYANGQKTTADAVRFVYDTGRLQRWIGQQRADLIHVGGPRLLPAAALGAQGRPVIFQAQHFFEQSQISKIIGWATRRANIRIIANSKHVARQFEKYTNVDIVYQGVNDIEGKPEQSRPVRTFGLIGRIAPMKGQTDFLRAAAILAPSLRGARFVICGAPMFCPSNYIGEVEKLASGLPVDFLGWREDISEVLKTLDVLVVPSTKAEATTRVILEAFAAGVPVVAYTVAGIPEIISNGINGFLVPECEPEALARKLSAVSSMDLSEVIKRARLDWEEKYTVQRYREGMVGVMSNVVDNRGC